MLSDEEKEAIEWLKSKINEYVIKSELDENIEIILNLIENLIFKTETQKELLKYKTDKIEKQSKEIEELKEDKYGLEEEVQIQAKNIMLYENTLCEIQDKIKAKIEPRLKELDEQMKKEWKEYGNSREYQDMEDEWNFLHSLLEKE